MKKSIAISDDVVFFIHIPKCAGTSLGSFFNKMLRPGGHFFWHGHDGDINKLADEDAFFSSDSNEGIKFIGGHFTVGAVNKIISDAQVPNPTICSVIRDPLEQVESYFHWITSESAIKGVEHPLYEHCKAMTPEAFFCDEKTLAEVSNIQSKYLLGVDCGARHSHDIESLSLSLISQRSFYIADVSESDLLISRMAELLLTNDSNSQQVILAPRENVSGARTCKFNEATIDTIKELCWADIILYETLNISYKNAANSIFF
ncbi:hypothetical protein [Pseudomonas syringae group sp. 247E2]|uniref:hypothetical protein n=1 Tax=Pseudomonas syringae group sp. 247E2 TaxID=3079592 RepID=UPI002910582C|nr:hypothetical protein [Pseudomonas syringae group sp. 247E2]MDU8606935.1 hypothetical protein [Pseudomonas syringae group sp. 247E2]